LSNQLICNPGMRATKNDLILVRWAPIQWGFEAERFNGIRADGLSTCFKQEVANHCWCRERRRRAPRKVLRALIRWPVSTNGPTEQNDFSWDQIPQYHSKHLFGKQYPFLDQVLDGIQRRPQGLIRQQIIEISDRLNKTVFELRPGNPGELFIGQGNVRAPLARVILRKWLVDDLGG
jgi:hypothetical protein